MPTGNNIYNGNIINPDTNYIIFCSNASTDFFRLSTKVNFSLYKKLVFKTTIQYESENNSYFRVGVISTANDFYTYKQFNKSEGEQSGKTTTLDISNVNGKGYFGVYYQATTSGVRKGAFLYLYSVEFYS